MSGEFPNNNPFAPPESPHYAAQSSELPAGSSWVVDGDGVLTGGDVTWDWLCFETGIPVTPGSRLLFVKVFAPTPQKQIVFRLFQALSVVAILMSVVMGRMMKWGAVSLFGIPSFIWLWGYIGLFVLVLYRTPCLRIHYCVSPEGKRIATKRWLIRFAGAGFFLCGPALVILPELFRSSFPLGLISMAGVVLVMTAILLLCPFTKAVRLPNGVFRVSNLPTQLLPALREPLTHHSSRRPPSRPDFIR